MEQPPADVGVLPATIGNDPPDDLIPASLLRHLAPKNIRGYWVTDIIDQNEVVFSFYHGARGPEDLPVVTYTATIAATDEEVRRHCSDDIYHFDGGHRAG